MYKSTQIGLPAKFFRNRQNPYHHHNEETGNMTEDQSLVTFVLGGKYEWYEKNREHAQFGLYDNHALTVCASPPSDDVGLRSNKKKRFLK